MPRHMRMRPDIPRQPVFVSRHMLLCRGMSRYVSYFTHVNGYSKELPRSTRHMCQGYVTSRRATGAAWHGKGNIILGYLATACANVVVCRG